MIAPVPYSIEHVVGDPDRKPVVVDRVRDEPPGGDPGLLLLGVGSLGDRAACRMAHVVHDLLLVRSPLHQALDERVLGREDEERGAEERVGARREDRDVDVELLDAKDDLRSLPSARSSCAAS
jgi:hypothetical protein